MKKLKYSVPLLAVMIVLFVFVLTIRCFELKGYFNFSADAWLGFIGTMTGIVIAFFGFIVGIYKYFEDKEEKDTPIISINLVEEQSNFYRCYRDTDSDECYLHKYVYIEIINNGIKPIYNPYFLTETGKQLYITKDEGGPYLQLIPPKSLTDEKCIVEIDIPHYEGMSWHISEYFEFHYRNYNNKKFKQNFCVYTERSNDKNSRITFDNE